MAFLTPHTGPTHSLRRSRRKPRAPSSRTSADRGLLHAMIIYRTVTRDPRDATVFALGLLHSILSAGLVAVLLPMAGPARLGYWRRYGFVVLAGAAGSYTVEILHLIW